MSDEGALFWRHRILHEDDPIVFAGRTLTECIASFNAGKPRAGTVIQKLFGGAVVQRSPGLERAPLDLEPEEFDFSFETASLEGDYHLIRRGAAIASREAIEFFFADPIEDVWIIGAEEQTVWTLSRSLPFGTVAYAALEPPRAWIADNQTGATDDELTVVTTGPPDALEVLVSDTTNASTIETADLSAHAGRFLIFRYYPLRLVMPGEVSRAIPTANGLDFSAAFSEVVPSRDAY